MKPATADANNPNPRPKTSSIHKPNATQPRPMKSADEYKFVTGGRPEIYIRKSMAVTCITNVSVISVAAAAPSDFQRPLNQATATSTMPTKYSKMPQKNNCRWLK